MSDSDDFRCPRCGEWHDADLTELDRRKINSTGKCVWEVTCQSCRFDFQVEAIPGPPTFFATCLDHSWETIINQGLLMEICTRCKEGRKIQSRQVATSDKAIVGEL